MRHFLRLTCMLGVAAILASCAGPARRDVPATSSATAGTPAAGHLGNLPVPPLSGPVVDQAGVLLPSEKFALDALAREAHAAEDGTGPQLGFLTVRSLEGENIDDYSLRVARNWKLGTAEKNNGLLFVISVDDRLARIEVGTGLEDRVTNAQAASILRDVMFPAFRQGAYGDGLLAGANRALSLISSR